MMNWNSTGRDWGSGNWVAMSLIMLLFWSLIVAAVVVVVRVIRSCNYELAPAGRNARDILDQRFAAGEITEAEYTHRRDVLRIP